MRTGLIAAAGVLCLTATSASAEMLAITNYESKPGQEVRKEGLAIIDVDPASPNFGRIVENVPLPPDAVAHHIYYTPDKSKAYITALGQSAIYVMDMRAKPYEARRVDVSKCKVGENVVFSEDGSRWYMSCMGSNNVIVGDTASDAPVGEISGPGLRHPHGIAIHEGIDRMLVTSTVNPETMKDAGEVITEIELSTGRVVGTHRLSDREAPAEEAPVEVVFAPRSEPPVAFITNMYGNSLWTAEWQPEAKDFRLAKVFDFAAIGAGVPLEIYFSEDRDKLYVTSAQPGGLHIFDVSQELRQPRLERTVAAAEGAHHVAFSPDGRYAFVQNSLLNLPGMSDGSITVVDLEAGESVASIDTLKDQGFNPNSIVMMPGWD